MFYEYQFITDSAIPAIMFADIMLGSGYPEDISSDDLRELLDGNGWENVWDYPLEDKDEALANNDNVIAVLFHEWGEDVIRIFEVPDSKLNEFYDALR